MTELQVRVGGTRIERERPAVGALCLCELIGVAPLAGFLQCVTILNPNWRIAGISIKRLAIKLSSDLPLSAISGLVGQGHCARLPAQQAEPLRVNDAVQYHSPSIRLRDRICSRSSEAHSDAEETQYSAPPSTRLVGFRRRRSFATERSDSRLADLPSRGERVLQPSDFSFQRRHRRGAV